MSSSIDDLIARRLALLDAWRAKQREIAALQAEAAALLAERWELLADEVATAPQHRDAIERSMVAEYSAAGRISKGSMEYAFSDARLLHEDFAAVRASHAAGRVTSAHVREIVRESDAVREAVASGTVSPDTLELYQAAVLEVAEADTPARTRVHARQVATALAATTVLERQEQAAAERTVTVRSIGDGLALLQAVLPEHLAVGIHDRLTAMARHISRHPEGRDPVLPPLEPEEAGWSPDVDRVPETRADADLNTIFSSSTFSSDPFDENDPYVKQLLHDMAHAPTPVEPIYDESNVIHLPPDERTIDQIRADLFTDLLLASDPSEAHGSGLDNIHATVQVTVAATTIAGGDDQPAELDGHGPLRPDIARVLAGDRTGWTRLFLDPAGLVTETDTYTPTQAMRRYLRARDQHCRFPGCRQPVHRCDVDHNHDHALGGPTATDNLAHFCRAHHVLKHPDIPEAHRWTARQLPDWSIEWTSPNGRHYSDAGPRRVMFVPSEPTADRDPSSRSEADRPPGHIERSTEPTVTAAAVSAPF